jgi:hypothetical protein
MHWIALASNTRLDPEMNTITSEELFQSWLAHMDDAIDAFMLTVPEPIRSQLDGSPDSLDLLEAWLLSRYSTISESKKPTESQVMDGATRFVGEIFRIATGSKWALEVRDPKALYFKLPILRGGRFDRMPECPMSLVSASLDRRTGRYLSSILKNVLR